MGCDGSYMEPRAAERDSKETAEHLVYAIEALGNVPPITYVNAAKEYYGSPSMLDELVRCLCNICKRMSYDERERIIYDGRNPKARKLATWYDRHVEADEKRIAAEVAALEMSRVREAALKKLTPIEIEALGVKL